MYVHVNVHILFSFRVFQIWNRFCLCMKWQSSAFCIISYNVVEIQTHIQHVAIAIESSTYVSDCIEQKECHFAYIQHSEYSVLYKQTFICTTWYKIRNKFICMLFALPNGKTKISNKKKKRTLCRSDEHSVQVWKASRNTHNEKSRFFFEQNTLSINVFEACSFVLNVQTSNLIN